VSSENQRLVELGLLIEEVSLVELQEEVFLEEVWLKTMVGEAGQVEVLLKRVMVGEGLVVALQKTGKVGEELVVVLLMREMEAFLVGAQKVASLEGACQVVAR
jgi:hypothetical protein